MIFAADTAPTAGGFQGFEIYHVKNPMSKQNCKTANNQPYVSTPVVLVFCMNPSRIKMNFPAHNQKVLGARRYTGEHICNLLPSARPHVGLDRHDRRAKGDAGACHRFCPRVYLVPWLLAKDATSKPKS